MELVKIIDLFAGTGAFSYAFKKVFRKAKHDIKCVFANDFCTESESIYNLNHSNKLTIGDINKIKLSKIPKHDILMGGFSCQPFSISGLKKGFDDERSNVFWTIIRILKKHMPNVFVLENVKNLQSHDKGNTFKIIYASLKKLGYHIKYKILNTCKITKIPQNRERIYIVGFKNKEQCKRFNFDFEEVECDNISDYLEDVIPAKYYYNKRFKVYDQIKKEVVKSVSKNIIYQYRRFYIRECKGGVCPTLTANMGGGGHNVPLIKDKKGIRKLTPRECFNLQGFPKNYKLPAISDSRLYKLAGNAVSVPVVKLIAEKILIAMR